MINIAELPYSSTRFYKGIYTSEKNETKEFEIVLEVNTEDKRKKVSFFPRGFKYSNEEREMILRQFNAGLGGRDICMDGENLIEE